MRSRIHDTIGICMMLAATYALKAHYSSAGADALLWILAPTAWLVERWLDTPFVMETHVGYVSQELRFVIAPSCAGVNFMVVTICAATLGFVGRMRTLPQKLAFVAASIVFAYAVTVGVNALRIRVALFVQQHWIALGTMPRARIHHIEGVVVYFTSLCALYLLAERFISTRSGVSAYR